MLLSVATVTWYYVERIDYYFDRNRLAAEQLDSVIRMSAAMNRYSENVAELLLLGRTELDDFTEARTSLESVMLRLERLILDEMAMVADRDERAAEKIELDRVRRMRLLYQDIDMKTQRLLFLREQDRLQDAIDIFREQIEDRLDTDLETEMAAAIADEENELRRLSQITNRLESQFQRIILAVTLVALLISSCAALLLSRSLRRPIAALASATTAMAEGDLAYRIAYKGRDEFAGLAAQFDIAASRLQAQRSELLRVQAGLEHEVGRRTGELEEANARLKQLDRMRMLFLADIGHELRTPLTVLRGEAEIELRGNRSVQDHRETLQRIVQLTQQMGRLIDDLLFLSRAEVDAVRFVMQPLVAQDVLKGALSEARTLAAGRDITIDAHLHGTGLKVIGDAGRLMQAYLNILDNAHKYGDRGSVITVESGERDGCAVVTVRNIGPAIAQTDLPFVFGRFYRGAQPDPAADTGSGLGLAIAKWIVDGHKGYIDISSADHETVVTISLPLRV